MSTHQGRWDLFFLQLAALYAAKSKDPSTKVGCVIVRPDNTQASAGYNGLPPGVADTPERLENAALRNELTLHAESNALWFIRDPKPLLGFRAYISPVITCPKCALELIRSGIKEIIVPFPFLTKTNGGFDLSASLPLFKEAGVIMRGPSHVA